MIWRRYRLFAKAVINSPGYSDPKSSLACYNKKMFLNSIEEKHFPGIHLPHFNFKNEKLYF